MARTLMTIFLARINDLVFSGTSCAFSNSGSSDTKSERKEHDLAEEKH